MLLPLLCHDLPWPDPERVGLLLATAFGAVPQVDVAQSGERYVLLADVPGLEPSALKLELFETTLVISGGHAKKPTDKPGSDATLLRRERMALGTFRRCFQLPHDVDLASISASLDKGVLRVSLSLACVLLCVWVSAEQSACARASCALCAR